VRRCSATLAVALAVLPPGRVRAQQVDVTLDAGVTSAAYDQYSRSAAFVIAPAVTAAGRRAGVEARSAVSLFEGGSRSVQLGASGRYGSAPRGPLSVELRADAGVTAYNRTTPIGYGRADLLARYRPDGVLQVAAGPTVGVVSNAPGARPLLGFTAGVWGGDGAASYGCRVSPAHVGPLAYADTELWGGYRRGAVELDGTAGIRAGDLGLGARAWVNAGAALWVARRVAMVVGAGAYPADILQGVPGGRYATLAVRVSARGARSRAAGVAEASAALARAVARPRAGEGVPTESRGAARGFTVEPARGGHRLALRAPGAERVEVMGDFTRWEPVALTRDARGRWQVVLPIPSGARRFNVRVDGGPWTVPAGVAVVEDDFGGSVGVLSIE
jgi:hypothetical protein